jgi:hypothetical protein
MSSHYILTYSCSKETSRTPQILRATTITRAVEMSRFIVMKKVAIKRKSFSITKMAVLPRSWLDPELQGRGLKKM